MALRLRRFLIRVGHISSLPRSRPLRGNSTFQKVPSSVAPLFLFLSRLRTRNNGPTSFSLNPTFDVFWICGRCPRQAHAVRQVHGPSRNTQRPILKMDSGFARSCFFHGRHTTDEPLIEKQKTFGPAMGINTHFSKSEFSEAPVSALSVCRQPTAPIIAALKKPQLL